MSSSIDEATQKLLSRGKRLVELLIQPVFNPIPVSNQIVSLYAGLNGYLDNFDVNLVSSFENSLYTFLNVANLFNDNRRSLDISFNEYQISRLLFIFTTWVSNSTK